MQIIDALIELFNQSNFVNLPYQNWIMIGISFVLLYMAIIYNTYKKKQKETRRRLREIKDSNFASSANLNEIDEIIIGYNKGFKTYGIKNSNLKGKDKRKTNQNFIQIPISRFKDKIKLKALELGIYIRIINESYTSKS